MTENTNHKLPPGDVLDRAAAAVQGAAVPDPPADLLAATVAAVHNRITLAEAADVARRRRRVWIMRGMSIGGLAACLAVAVTWGGKSAAANVLLIEALANQKPPVAIKRIDRTERPGQPAVVETYYHQGKKHRREYLGGYSVWDQEAGRHFQFFLDSQSVLAQPDSRVIRIPSTTDAKPTVAGLNAVVKFAASGDTSGLDVTSLGVQPVSDRKLPAYRIRGLKSHRPTGLELDPADATYWVDPAIKRVVREVVTVTANPMPRTVTTDIEWLDNPLDPALFATDLPDGWTWFGTPPPWLSKPEKTHPVSLKLAAEAVAAAPCMVVTNTQRLLPGRPELTAKMFVRGKQLRVEFLNPGGNGLPDPTAVPAIGAIIGAFDGDQTLHLNFAEKTAKFEKRQGPRPATFPDLVAGFRQLKDEDGEPAGEEKVGDVTAKVFKLKNADFIGAKGPDVRATVWLDPTTSLPLRVVAGDDNMELRFEQFEWPAKMDDALFSLTPPKGYTVGEFVPPASEPAKK